ncbi:MBL fold metallo-hydrolase [Flavimaricola marinus]|uniref:Metallo-beta-lactamase L1 n=1 Tax=Flavimaricola marinus TaxID=1819565 RepID=A0A238LI74_9RHOB|nr:MBL fold metallo-hydrolase [Flavimaricola marinus]SMY09328.1 Metallo-beta-lactamase L1 precursor [Flavimaricola marinus]
MTEHTSTAIHGCCSAEILQKFVEFGKTGTMPKDLSKWLDDPKAQYIEPWKPFDNVHFVGVCWVSAWLIETSDGAVLIDTMYGPHVDPLIENIRSTGIDFADIKYVLMTHGHFDHVGGAAQLRAILPNARFAMTQKGWDETVDDVANWRGTPNEYEMLAPELVLADGESITCGDAQFTVIETPGHTWGTASYLYDVFDRGKRHRAITVGGLGLNAIDGPSQVEAFLSSLDRIEGLVRDSEAPVMVHLTMHGFSANLEENRQIHAERKAGDPNVFLNPEAVLKEVAFLRDGAARRLEIERKKAAATQNGQG